MAKLSSFVYCKKVTQNRTGQMSAHQLLSQSQLPFSVVLSFVDIEEREEHHFRMKLHDGKGHVVFDTQDIVVYGQKNKETLFLSVEIKELLDDENTILVTEFEFDDLKVKGYPIKVEKS